jgi:hypothetical protein
VSSEFQRRAQHSTPIFLQSFRTRVIAATVVGDWWMQLAC